MTLSSSNIVVVLHDKLVGLLLINSVNHLSHARYKRGWKRIEGGGKGWKRKEEQRQTMKEDEKYASTKGPHTTTCSGQYRRTLVAVSFFSVCVKGRRRFMYCFRLPLPPPTRKGDSRLREGGGRAHASRERRVQGRL